MFNCKKLFKLQVRPPNLILLITTSQDRWTFPSQSWEVKNSMMMMMMMIIIIIIIIIIILFLYLYKILHQISAFSCVDLYRKPKRADNLLHFVIILNWLTLSSSLHIMVITKKKFLCSPFIFWTSVRPTGYQPLFVSTTEGWVKK